MLSDRATREQEASMRGGKRKRVFAMHLFQWQQTEHFWVGFRVKMHPQHESEGSSMSCKTVEST